MSHDPAADALFYCGGTNLSFSKAAQHPLCFPNGGQPADRVARSDWTQAVPAHTALGGTYQCRAGILKYAVRITDLAEDAARRTAAAAECSTPLEIGMMSGMENPCPILEKLLLFRSSTLPFRCTFILRIFPPEKTPAAEKLDFALQLELVPLEDAPSCYVLK